MANDVANGQTVADIQEMMRDAGFGLKHLPIHLEILLRDEAWRHRVIKQTGKVATFDRFQDFVEANLCAGLESTVEQLRHLCRDNLVVLDLIDQAVQEKPGKRASTDIIDNVKNITPADGNGRSFALRRLRSQRPDLHSKVVKGELSPHSAMIEAGFRQKTLTVPLDPQRAAGVIKRHFNEEQIIELIEYLVTKMTKARSA